MPFRSDLNNLLEHERASNTPIDATPTHMLKAFLTTQRGWILRKLNESATTGFAALATYQTAHGIPGDVISTEGAFFLAIASWLGGLALSKLADTANKELPPPVKN